MKKTISICLLAITLILSGCNNEKTKVTLALSKNPWNTIALVAADKGYFAEEGLDVTLNYQDAGRYCYDAVISQSADFGNIVDVNISYIGYSPNKNTFMLAEINRSPGSVVILGKKSRGINSPSDLKGKTIAFSAGTVSDVFARRFVQKYKIADDSITFQKIQPKGIIPAFAANDGPPAVAVWEPFISAAHKGLGDDIVTFESPEIYTIREFVAVRTDWAKEHKDAIQKYLRAMKKAETFVNSNEVEAQKIVARMAAMDLEIVKSSWPKYKAVVAYDKATYLKEIMDIGKEVSTLDDYKGKQVPDYSSFFDDSYFNDAK
ncbi:MAG: putative aliphatic sulfonates-binding protein [Bacteroidetes bacterium]|nr:putative aliphatic sulfonates-binding protein [Bacteroidota bacterium]